MVITAITFISLPHAGQISGAGHNSNNDLHFYLNGDINLALKNGIGNALDRVLGLRAVVFKWRTEEYADEGFPEGEHFDGIAQEAEEVLPEIVKEGHDGEKSVAYAEIIPVLIESIRELKVENDALKDRIAALEVSRD